MSDASKLKRFTAAGAIGVGPSVINGALLVAAGAPATCDIREGGASGTVVATLSAPASGSGYFAVDGPMLVTDPYLGAITAGAALTIAY